MDITVTFDGVADHDLVGALVDPPDHVIHAYEQLQEIAA